MSYEHARIVREHAEGVPTSDPWPAVLPGSPADVARWYTSPTADALLCAGPDGCGALVVDLPAHEAWHDRAHWSHGT